MGITESVLIKTGGKRYRGKKADPGLVSAEVSGNMPIGFSTH